MISVGFGAFLEVYVISIVLGLFFGMWLYQGALRNDSGNDAGILFQVRVVHSLVVQCRLLRDLRRTLGTTAMQKTADLYHVISECWNPAQNSN